MCGGRSAQPVRLCSKVWRTRKSEFSRNGAYTRERLTRSGATPDVPAMARIVPMSCTRYEIRHALQWEAQKVPVVHARIASSDPDVSPYSWQLDRPQHAECGHNMRAFHFNT
jgi:hypothetical protein